MAGTGGSDTRPFVVSCDWCGRPITGQIRREQVGKMVLVKAAHLDARGQDCQGTGRALAAWPLEVEISADGGGYELRIGDGRPIEYARREDLVARLLELGVDHAIAELRVGAARRGERVVLEVSDRRRSQRGSGKG